jgi:hypothetical protein
MKLQYLLPALFAGSALSGAVSARDNKHCLSDEDAKDLIQGYVTTFQGIPPGGKFANVEKVAKKTFANDIKMYSQSLLWVKGYQGPVRSPSTIFFKS